MVKKFFDYFKESVEDSSLPYYFSRKLSDFLLEIVANAQDVKIIDFVNSILKIESKTDIKSTFTFIDLTDKNDMVSMVQSGRIYQIWKKSGSDQSFKDWISYEKVNPDSQVWTSNRSQIAIGRAFRKISSDTGKKIEDKTIEGFVNTFKSLYDFKWNLEGRFELVEGELIRKWYNLENYASRSGQLGNSCMRYSNCSSYFDIYVYNPKVCKLLILYEKLNKKEISGRALVWTTESGEVYVDRIYTNKDSDIKLFESYVQKMGWTTKWSYSRTVKLEVWDFEKYPYMDSFSILDFKNGVLYSDEDKWPAENLYLLRQTDGSFKSGNDLVYSEYYNDWIEREDAINLDGDWIRKEDAIYLEYKNEYIHPHEDYNYSNYFGDNILPEDSVYSEILGDYLFTDQAIKIPSGNFRSEGEIRVSYDYLPETSDEVFQEVVYFSGGESKIGKTISDFIVNSPISGVNYLLDGILVCYLVDGEYLTEKDAKVLDKSISDKDSERMLTKEYISKLVENSEITKDDLNKYILESDFDFKDHLIYIRGLNDIYYQSFFYSNPRLISFQSIIQKFLSTESNSKKFNRLLKICLTNYDHHAWTSIPPKRASSFELNRLHKYFESILENEKIDISPLELFKSFQLAGILKTKILVDKTYLKAWYKHYQFKQN